MSAGIDENLAGLIAGKIRGALAAVLMGYIDESGTHDDARVVCAGGYLFDVGGTEVFAKNWRPFLDEKRLRYFHASDCSGSKDEGEIFSALIDLIVRSARTGVVRFIARNSLDSLERNLNVQQFAGSGYSLCTLSCMERMAALARESGEQVVYFIEDGNEYSGELRHFLNQIKDSPELKQRFAMEGADTYSKENVIQLQAADLLVWEFCRAYINALTVGRTEWRESLKKLCELPHHVSGFSEISASVQAMVNSVYGLKSNRTRF